MSFGRLINGVTKRFSSEFEYKQVHFLFTSIFSDKIKYLLTLLQLQQISVSFKCPFFHILPL